MFISYGVADQRLFEQLLGMVLMVRVYNCDLFYSCTQFSQMPKSLR